MKNFTIPLLSLLIIVPITIMVFGPLGSSLSNGIAQVYMTLYGFNKTIAGGFIGAIAQVLVVFGIHWGLFPIIFANIQKYGYDTILAVFGPSIIAQAGAAFGVMLKTKNKKIKEIASPAALIGFFGISETSIYGINLRFKKPFLMAIIGGGIGGAIVGASGSRAIAVAVASVPSFPVYFGKGFVGFLIGYFGAFVISAVLTYLFGYSDDMIEATEKDPAKTDDSIAHPSLTIQAPVDGKVEALSTINDSVFSSGTLGSGLAIVPSGEEIVAPTSGIVTATFDSGHAYGIRTNDGSDLLVHIGIDTVKLKGTYFTPKVKKGDVVLKGDILAHIDLDGIIAAGFDPTVIVVLTNATANTKLSILTNDHVKAKEPLLQFVM
ncbi:glucose PTS transporter subunit IIA [Sporolactobacillus sp. STCC-11]|uniref:glucose PTS transporter subunit IIA n=1 Tax=Sporolactobacillus caesalpiniae TaxID=3230362 RepID=UPI0033959F70